MATPSGPVFEILRDYLNQDLAECAAEDLAAAGLTVDTRWTTQYRSSMDGDIVSKSEEVARHRAARDGGIPQSRKITEWTALSP